jgi:hypothetical protein
MFVPLQIVQDEHDPVPGGKPQNRAFQSNPLSCVAQADVLGRESLSASDFLLITVGVVIGVRHGVCLAATEVHKHFIHCDPVQPGRKQRVAPERMYAPECVQEGFMQQVFSDRGVADHPQADVINTA